MKTLSEIQMTIKATDEYRQILSEKSSAYHYALDALNNEDLSQEARMLACQAIIAADATEVAIVMAAKHEGAWRGAG